MVFLKLYWHITSFIKICLYKLLYGKKIQWKISSTFRSGFKLLIIGNGKCLVHDNVFFNNDCSINCMVGVEIGEGTLFGENVKIYDHNHRYKTVNIAIKDQGYTYAPVKIGSHCWIASNVTILKGVTIGDNCTIGAGCIIHKDVPPNTVVINKQNLTFISSV